MGCKMCGGDHTQYCDNCKEEYLKNLKDQNDSKEYKSIICPYCGGEIQIKIKDV